MTDQAAEKITSGNAHPTPLPAPEGEKTTVVDRGIDRLSAAIDSALTDATNAAFDCGEWDDDDEEPYDAVHDRSLAARDRVRDLIREALALIPQLLDSLQAVEWGGALVIDEEHGDCVDACPNCYAPAPDLEIEGAGQHYAHCELRDSLDAALGVTSQRIVHPEHAKGVANG